MKELPEFRTRKTEDVIAFLMVALTHPNQDETHFRRLIRHDDGHYGAVFSMAYFGANEPTKSQWNSLKKKLKRHDKRVFVFKEHSILDCDAAGETMRCGCIEFGFFAH